MSINPKIVEYVRYYSSQGYSSDQIRKFLLSNNIPQADVDDAIARVNQSPQTVQSNPMAESRIRDYMQTQMSNGYGIEIIKNALIRQGFNPSIVNKVASDLNNVNINVRHEVNVSKGTIAGIVVAIFIIGAVVYGIFNFSMFQPKESLMDITVSTNVYSYMAGENVNYQVFVTNMGSIQRFDATLKSLIVDDAGNILTRKEETLAIETTSSINRNIQLPLSMNPGKYYLKILADYDDKQAKSSTEFEVVQNADDKKPVTYVPPNTNIDNNTSVIKNTTVKPGTRPNGNIPSNAGNGTTFGNIISDVRDTAQTNPESAAGKCAKLVSEEQKDICYEVVADSSASTAYCERVGDSTRKDNCYLAFVMKGNLDVCDKIVDKNSKEFCDQLRIVQLMNKYYAENNTEKILELSKQFNPDTFKNNPQVQTYEHIYTETADISILDVMSTPEENQPPSEEPAPTE